MSVHHYDRRGEKITKMQYDTLNSLDEYKHVARDTIGEYSIHTDWRGTVYGGNKSDLFTTYVHGLGNGYSVLGLPNQGYSSEADALKGHARVKAILEAIAGGDSDTRSLVERVHAALDGYKDTPIEVAKAATERRKRGIFG